LELEFQTINNPWGTHDSAYRNSSNGYNNVYCPNTSQYGLQLKDSQFIASGSDNISLPSSSAGTTNGCANVRVTGNVLYFPGGRGVVFNYEDLTVSDNVVDHSAGIGLDLTGAGRVSVGGNFFDDSGRGANGGAAINIDNTAVASICNNRITGNGEYSVNPAQIHFGGVNDEIDLCGNAYRTDQKPGDITLRPLYAYDADAGTVLTNAASA
jgi:hypothetical protein